MKDLNKFDLDFAAEHGRLSQRDAQAVHTMLCNKSGIIDGDFVIADWNLRNGEGTWDCPPEKCDGPYVQKLTKMLIEFMKEQIEDARKRKQN